MFINGLELFLFLFIYFLKKLIIKSGKRQKTTVLIYPTANYIREMLSVRMDPAGPKDQKVFGSHPFVYPFDAVETPWRHLGLERLVSGIKSL